MFFFMNRMVYKSSAFILDLIQSNSRIQFDDSQFSSTEYFNSTTAALAAEPAATIEFNLRSDFNRHIEMIRRFELDLI